MQSPTAKWWKNKAAFTLLETVLVLAIVCMLLALPSFCLTKLRQRASMRQTMVLVIGQLEYDKRYAVVSGLPVQVDYDCKNHILNSEFYRGGTVSHLQLPRDVNVDLSSTDRLLIGNQSCPAQTIKFYRGDEKNEVTMQMEWGKFKF